MSAQPKALRLADVLEKEHLHTITVDMEAAAELRRLHSINADLLAVCKELEESAGYWSEYDVPLGIVDRLRAAIAKAEGRGA